MNLDGYNYNNNGLDFRVYKITCGADEGNYKLKLITTNSMGSREESVIKNRWQLANALRMNQIDSYTDLSAKLKPFLKYVGLFVSEEPKPQRPFANPFEIAAEEMSPVFKTFEEEILKEIAIAKGKHQHTITITNNIRPQLRTQLIEALPRECEVIVQKNGNGTKWYGTYIGRVFKVQKGNFYGSIRYQVLGEKEIHDSMATDGIFIELEDALELVYAPVIIHGEWKCKEEEPVDPVKQKFIEAWKRK